jgi:hypothetical protein
MPVVRAVVVIDPAKTPGSRVKQDLGWSLSARLAFGREPVTAQ